MRQVEKMKLTLHSSCYVELRLKTITRPVDCGAARILRVSGLLRGMSKDCTNDY